MPDAVFDHPRLAAIYDALDPDRGDLTAYLDIAAEVGARRVVDVGCGSGTLAVLMAGHGLGVTGLDPAGASLAVARAKPGAQRVRWIHGDAAALPAMQVDLATMTGNVAQAIADPADWAATLSHIRRVLRPGGHLVFETRDPAARGWQEWTRAASYARTRVPDVGTVQSWVELTDVRLPLVSFRHTFVFESDGAVLTSDSTLRFRDRSELEADLLDAGYTVLDVRGAPDRPGRELVVLAARREH